MSTYEIGSIVFDKWKICRELGQGSYGTVYEIKVHYSYSCKECNNDTCRYIKNPIPIWT